MKKLIVAALLLFCASSAFGLSITRTGTELATGTFSNTSITADAVVLGTTGRTLWPGIDGDGVFIKTDATDADGIALAGDGSGGTFLAWRQWRPVPGDYILVLGYVPSSGSLGWVTGEVDPTTIEAVDLPRLIKSTKSGSADGAIIVWSRASNIIGGKFKTDRTLKWFSTRICTAEYMQDEPELVSDNYGGAVIVWKDLRKTGLDTDAVIFAQRLNEYGSIESGWANNGIQISDNANHPASSPKIVSLEADSYMIAYDAELAANNDKLYAQKIDAAGSRKFTNDKEISAKNDQKRNWTVKRRAWPSSGMIVAFDNGAESVGDVYAQRMDPSGNLWSADGTPLAAKTGPQWNPKAACLPDGKALFCWLDSSSGTIEAHFQKLNVYGTPEWESDGKIFTEEGFVMLEADGSGGAYGSGTDFSYTPRVYRIDGNGNMLWGNSGIPVSALSYYQYRTGEALPIIASDDGDGVIIGWASKSGSNTNVYVQKVGTRFFAGGIYTSAQFQNTDTGFVSWGNITWEPTGTITAEVRTAASLSGLNSASWTPATSGGSIPSNGNCIQSRFYFASNSGGTSTQSLRSYSLNYSVDTAFPSIESVKADTVTLSTSTTTDIAPSPTIEATLTDDQRINSADIKVDNVSVSYSTVSSTDTRWVIRSTITTPLSAGSHTIKVEVIDSAGNNTTNTYNVAVASRAEVKSGSIAGFSEGSKITVAYELSLPVDVTIEIRDLTGTLVQKFVVPGGAVGGNSVSVDRAALGKGAYIVIITPAGGSPVSGTAAF